MKKKIKIGIFGLGRGNWFFPAILHEGAEVVAVCERDEWKINRAKEYYNNRAGAKNEFVVYNDFEQFLQHDMDAVILCNFFNEHTRYAIKCLEKGLHVLSECQSNVTMADGVALVRAAEKSKAQFMLLENYPFMLFNLEMKKVVEGGTLGKILYAEGEYNHPGQRSEDGVRELYGAGEKHWRRFLPRTYYVTHSLAPLMYITGTRPKRVTAMPIFSPNEKSYSMTGDIASIMTTVNEDDSVFRFFGHSSWGYEENSYRFCGLNGQVENVRGDESKIMLAYNAWSKPEDKEKVNFYKAEWSEEDKEIAEKMGHAGGDFFVIRAFLETIRGERENPFDVYFATTLASVGILAHRSQLEQGVPYDIPDFRKEEDRIKWENDRLTPFWDGDTPPSVPCCSRPDYRPDGEAVEWFRKTWSKLYQK